jgi:hypothetical protein
MNHEPVLIEAVGSFWSWGVDCTGFSALLQI